MTILVHFVKRGGLLSQREVRRGLRSIVPGWEGELEGLRGVWFERVRWRGEIYWSLIDLARAARTLRDLDVLPPHHGGRQ